MEYVYQLDLPPASEIFLDDFTGFDDSYAKPFNYQYREDIEKIFKPEWLTFKDIRWDIVLFFRKNNYEGKIHTDIPVKLVKTKLFDLYTPWGVTWVWDGPGRLEYWNFEDLDEDYITTGAFNTEKGKVWTYINKTQPAKSYDLIPNKVYLVNGRQPHKATGWNHRKTISYRTLDKPFTPWTSIIEKFQDIII